MNALARLPTPIVIWTALPIVATANWVEFLVGKAMVSVDRSMMLEDWSLETPVNERSLESFAKEASSPET